MTAIKQTLQTKMEALDHFQRFSAGISVIVLLIGGLIVFTNMMASVNERRREIGIFRAIGFRQSHVIRIIFLEALIVGVIAGGAGVVLGSGISRVVAPMMTGMKGGGFVMEPPWPEERSSFPLRSGDSQASIRPSMPQGWIRRPRPPVLMTTDAKRIVQKKARGWRSKVKAKDTVLKRSDPRTSSETLPNIFCYEPD